MRLYRLNRQRWWDIWSLLLPHILSHLKVREGTGDQIFASIVSTLLALMDGVTARGQVVVIGATNRFEVWVGVWPLV